MSLQNPGALFWILPLAGVIIVLYLLRMRRRDVRVPASFLWPARTEEIRANSLFQRLRFNWLLVLQLLAVAIAVAALARPQTRQFGLTGEVTVIVIDASASMGATDELPSRFESAKRQVRDAIQGSKAGDRIALIEAGPMPRVIFPLGSDPARQIRALDSVGVTDAESDVGEAMRLASALVGGLEGARIVLLSDGCFAPISDFSPGKAAVVYRQVGQKSENLAVSALGVSDTPSGRQAYVGVRNFGFDARNAGITLLADGKPIDSIRFDVPGGKTWGRTIPISADAKVLEARLDSKDLLPADDVAYALTDLGSSLHVLLVSKGDFFLERALALDPRVSLDKTPTVPVTEKGSGASAYDVVVFDGVPEEPVRARAVITLGSAGVSSPVEKRGSSDKPKFVDARDVPLMRGVQLDGLYIDKAEKVRPLGSAEVVAESDEGPLIVTRSSPKRQIFVAFSPLDSDLPLQVAFPILMANALSFCATQTAGNAFVIRPGQPFNVPTANGRVTLAGTNTSDIGVATHDGIATVRGVRSVGEYTLSVDGKLKQVLAQLRSDRESNIDPVSAVKLGGGKVKAVGSPARFGDFWRPLLLVCLLVLAGEWWLYARRS